MVVNRMVEQWDALLLYFTNNVAEHRLQSSEMILHQLQNLQSRLFFYFLQFILPKFSLLNEFFQSEKVLLACVFKKYCESYKELLLLFMNAKYVNTNNLHDINPEDSEKYLPLNNLYLGVKVLNDIDKISSDLKYDFLFRCRKFLITACVQLKQRFDFRDDCFLNKISIFDLKNNECKNIHSLFQILKLFPRIVDLNDLNGLQKIDNQWRTLISTNFSQEILDKDIDVMWNDIMNLENGNGEKKFKELSHFVLSVLSAPHSNASCERVFSKVNLIKTDIRNKLKTKTVNSLLLSSDLVKTNTCFTFEPPTELFKLIGTRDTYRNDNNDVEPDLLIHDNHEMNC